MESQEQQIKRIDEWSNFKKKLLLQHKDIPFFHEREIWWCALGENVGFEISGKHENFERPVLIFKKFDQDSLLILPMTSQNRIGISYYQFIDNNKLSCIILSQIRFISSKRLLRKKDNLKIGIEEFSQIKALIKVYI